MKAFTVNKNSWHYVLNTKMCMTNDRLDTAERVERYIMSKDNLCSYWRMTLWSSFKALVAVSFIAGVVGFLLFTLYSIGAAFIINPVNSLKVTLVIVGTLSLVIGIIYVLTHINNSRRIKMNKILYEGETESSLAKAQYSSWKSGICVPVEFKG